VASIPRRLGVAERISRSGGGVAVADGKRGSNAIFYVFYTGWQQFATPSYAQLITMATIAMPIDLGKSVSWTLPI
jgi:hypothetical protein